MKKRLAAASVNPTGDGSHRINLTSRGESGDHIDVGITTKNSSLISKAQDGVEFDLELTEVMKSKDETESKSAPPAPPGPAGARS